MSDSPVKVSRVDVPSPGLLVLSLRGSASGEALVLGMLPGFLGVGLTGKRPQGDRATPSVSQLRRHLEGSSVAAVEASRQAVRVSLSRGERSYFLLASADKPRGAWWLQAQDGSVLVRSPGAPRQTPREGDFFETKDWSELRAAGEWVLEGHRDATRRQLGRALEKQLKRLQKKREAILGDLGRAGTAKELREQADLLLAHAHEIPGGASHFDARAWGDPARTVRIGLDPKKRPSELAQELFAKAKRLERGLKIAARRLQEVEGDLAALTRLQDAFERSSLEEVESELQRLGVELVPPEERARAKRRAGGRLPYRQFVAGDGSTVLVGRSAAENDRLTARVAKPHDLWLHARGVTGAHVVVVLQRNEPCTSQALIDAATLAAHFSDLRDEPLVDVLYTPRRFVRKRKGSPVGAVTLEREKVIAVRIEPERLSRLLQSEKRAS